jgi:hypothetical protein
MMRLVTRLRPRRQAKTAVPTSTRPNSDWGTQLSASELGTQHPAPGTPNRTVIPSVVGREMFMTDPYAAKQAHAAGSSIAAFQLSQFCLSALIKNGIVPKADAEQMLRQAVAANKTGGPGNQAAAGMLAIVLEQVAKVQPPTRQ